MIKLIRKIPWYIGLLVFCIVGEIYLLSLSWITSDSQYYRKYIHQLIFPTVLMYYLVYCSIIPILRSCDKINLFNMVFLAFFASVLYVILKIFGGLDIFSLRNFSLALNVITIKIFLMAIFYNLYKHQLEKF